MPKGVRLTKLRGSSWERLPESTELGLSADLLRESGVVLRHPFTHVSDKRLPAPLTQYFPASVPSQH